MKNINRLYTAQAKRSLSMRSDKASQKIGGHASVFYNPADPDGTEYQLYGDVIERVDPQCFDRALRERDDCRCLFNHHEDHLLGRVAAGTLRLGVDAVGLTWEVDLPDTTLGRELPVLLDRGDLTGCSFGFEVIRQEVARVDGMIIVTLKDVRLYDVGPVTFPAYTGTDAQVREIRSQALAQDQAKLQRSDAAILRQAHRLRQWQQAESRR